MISWKFSFPFKLKLLLLIILILVSDFDEFNPPYAFISFVTIGSGINVIEDNTSNTFVLYYLYPIWDMIISADSSHFIVKSPFISEIEKLSSHIILTLDNG